MENSSATEEDMVLNLEFCVRKTTSSEYYHEDGGVLFIRAKYSEVYQTTRLHYAVFFRVEDAYNAISRSLDRLGVHGDVQTECINVVISKAQELCQKNLSKQDHRENRVLCIVDLPHEHLVEDWQESTEDQDQGMEDEDEGMVPAALPAIRSLGATRIQVEEGNKNVQQCVICQEEYRDGEKVTCMPCLHMFHKDCITKWLLRSHLCPICKFQMPTSS